MSTRRIIARLGVVALLGLSLILVASPTSEAAEELSDGVAPVFTSMTFAPSTIDLSAPDPTVHVTATITDATSGVFTAYVVFTPPTPGYLTYRVVNLYLTAGDNLNGTWEGSFTFDPWTAENGVWTIDHMYARDNAANETKMYNADVVAAGYPTDLTLWSGVPSFEFSGFMKPIKERPALNAVKAGDTVTVKFGLGANLGLDVFADGYPKSELMACSLNPETLGTDKVKFAGPKGELRYDKKSNEYQFRWQTETSWKKTCRQLVLVFADGSVARANFQFK